MGRYVIVIPADREALLMAVRGEALIGFTEPVAKSICAEWGLEGEE